MLDYAKKTRFTFGELNKTREKPRVKTATIIRGESIKWKRPESEDPLSMKLIKQEIQKSVNLENHFTDKKAKVDLLFDNYIFHSIDEYNSKFSS